MRTVLGVTLLMVLAVLLGGCQLTAAPGTVTTSPANGATDVSPITPVTVTVGYGKLTDVALTNAAGKPVAGALFDDGHSWSTTEPVGYGKTYTYSGTATGADSKPVPVTGAVHHGQASGARRRHA